MAFNLGRRRRVAFVILIMVTLGTAGGWLVWDLTRERLLLATTTSTRDTGLLDYLIPRFEQRRHVKVDYVAVGTGQALDMAKRGDADFVLVHSKSLEEGFLASGYGTHRIGVMFNDFVVVGPSSDPAGIQGMTNVTAAFIKIFSAGMAGNTSFISRGDLSGTHTKELSIWNASKLTPSGTWYLESGRAMGDVLTMTNEKKCYTLADRGTWLAYKGRLELKVLVEGDKVLINPYALILVSAAKYPNRNHRMALEFVKYVISPEGQKAIEDFKVGGESLFTPIARNIDQARNLGFPNQGEELAWYDSQK